MGHDSEHPITIQREHLEAALPIVASILEHVGDAFNIEEGRHTAETYWDTAHMIRTALKVPTDARALESVDVPITAQFSQREIDFWRPDLISDPFGSEPDGDLKKAVESLGTMGRLGPETFTCEAIKPWTPPKYYRPKEEPEAEPEPEPEPERATPGVARWSRSGWTSAKVTMRFDSTRYVIWIIFADPEADLWKVGTVSGRIAPKCRTWPSHEILQAMSDVQEEMEAAYEHNAQQNQQVQDKQVAERTKSEGMAAILVEALLEHGTPD